MDRYIEQLIEDLEAAAKNPPKPFYVETPPVFDDDPSMAELAMVPFRTIEDLTGIKQEAFPNFNDMHGRHWKTVLDAIFEVFNSLKIKLIDIPRGMPKEWLYEAITTNWQYPVQYLPLSGMDLELCTGDPITCPYGTFCDCGHEWPDDEDFFELKREIPEDYEEFVPKMAVAIDAGLVCFLYANTLELKTIPQSVYEDTEKFGALFDIGGNGESPEINIFEEYFRVEPLLKYELDDMMEAFTIHLSDEALKTKLFNALNSKNRNERFNAIVLKSDENQNWLDFKQSWLKKHVRDTIWQDIKNSEDFPEEINGFFNDDGSRIDPATVPVAGLCIICKKYQDDDPEENFLCMLNRNDQRDNPDFICGAFEKI